MTEPDYEQRLAREIDRQRVRDDARRVLRAETRTVEPPAPARLDEFLAETPRRTTWWVKDLLPSGGRVLLAAAYKAGKAVDIDEPILTARGWVTMGTIREGDQVHAPDGTLVDVTHVSPVMYDRPCYRVKFADGREVVVDAEHLWAVRDTRNHHDKDVTLTTAEMAPGVIAWTDGARITHYRYAVAVAEPLIRPDVDLPIDPYVLGAWLGDGSSSSAVLTSADPEIPDRIRAAGYTVERRSRLRYSISRRDTVVAARAEAARLVVDERVSARQACLRVGLPIGSPIDAPARGVGVPGAREYDPAECAAPLMTSFVGQLRELGVLDDKHIPDVYLQGSEKQREALLQGLMDTDGHAQRTRPGGAGRVEFTNTNPQLSRGVAFLARSLGWKVSEKTGVAMLNGVAHGPKYRVFWTAYRDQRPFSLQRKLDALNERPMRRPRSESTRIVAIEPVESRPVRCIQVDHPTRLYLVGEGLIPTHNSTLTANLIRSLADGDPFLDAHDTQQVTGKVVLIDDELDRDMLRNWLADQHIVHPQRVSVFSLRGRIGSLDLLDPDTLTAWVDQLAALNPDVIVFDCLRPVLDALGLDENHDVGRFLVAFDALVDRCGAQAAIIVHHMGHTGERARGDSRLRDWPDVEWRLVRGNPEDPASPRYFTAYGRDVDQPERQLGYNPHTRRLAVTGGSRRGDATSELTGLVLAYVAEHPGQSGRTIQQAVCTKHGAAQKSTRMALAAAVESGRVVTQPGPGRSVLHFAADSSNES